MFGPYIRIDGVPFVVACGVVRYLRKAHTFWLRVVDLSLSTLLIARSKDCTNLSACPLVHGWYGVDVMCLIPFSARNCLNSADMNCGSLSETTSFGMP